MGRPEIANSGGPRSPGGRENPSKRWGASRHSFWKGSPGRQGRPDPKIRGCPVGPKTTNRHNPAPELKYTPGGPLGRQSQYSRLFSSASGRFAVRVPSPPTPGCPGRSFSLGNRGFWAPRYGLGSVKGPPPAGLSRDLIIGGGGVWGCLFVAEGRTKGPRRPPPHPLMRGPWPGVSS